MTMITKPADFDAFWQVLDDELALYDAAPALELSPIRTNEFSTMYFVRLTSVGPYRIFAYLSIPKGDGPFPGLLITPRYGSVNNPPHFDDRKRYVTMVVMHRGQRLADEPYAAAYPGLLTDGIEDARRYIYRGIAADCIRGAEFLLSRPEIEGKPVGIVGDDLAVITAARRSGFSALHVTPVMLYRMLEAAPRTTSYPLEEINEHLAYYPDSASQIADTIAYFDPLHHAADVTCRTLVDQGDPGTVSGPEFLEPFVSSLGGPVEIYSVTHEGGTDHDATDAWRSKQLGSEPAPRLWPESMG